MLFVVMRGKKTDLTGKAFGRYTVLSQAPRGKCYSTKWLCRCQCGTEKVVYALSLRSGNTVSCGCYAKENNSNLRTTHGHTKSSRSNEYVSWMSAKGRAGNPNDKKWERYGGRGIKMCLSWFESFENFLADMGTKQSSEYSIERINNDGNYSCGKCSQCLENGWDSNCRWATAKEQANNRGKRRKNKV